MARDVLETVDEQIAFCKQSILAHRMLLDGYSQRKQDLELEIGALAEKLRWLGSAAKRAPADIESQERELQRLRTVKRDMDLVGGGMLSGGSRKRLEGKKARLQRLLEKSARLMKELAEMGVEIEDLRPS